MAHPLGARRHPARLAAAAVLVLALACTDAEPSAGPTTRPPSPAAEPTSAPPEPEPAARTNALVTRVVDGDTLEVRFRGELLTVRLIGIDTPESVAPDEPVQCYALEAAAYTADRLEGRRVLLRFDVERIDPFGRTLAYVWLGEELFNETLVREGYAFVTTFPPNDRHERRFVAAEREAREAGRGVWGACVDPNACDPAYPDACIPPPPPDLDCDDVDERRFTVLPPDPHHFDGDGNGVGCEMG